MESIISTFHIDWKIIIAQAINFGIVFAVLYFFAFKPLGKIMNDRSVKISKGIEDGKRNAEILEKTQKEYDAILIQAKNEAHKIFSEGKKEAEEKKIILMEKTQKEVALMMENGKKTLEAEKVKIVDEAKNEIVFLATQMVEKIIAKKIDSSFDEKTLKDLGNL
jgi:F-type H+-transporting ATPase subunit b